LCKLANNRFGVRVAHQRLANQGRVRAPFVEIFQLLRLAYTAFDDNRLSRFRDLRHKAFGGGEIDSKRSKVSVVDADEGSAGCQSMFELRIVMDLDKRI
jgi:hypothetical protein